MYKITSSIYNEMANIKYEAYVFKNLLDFQSVNALKHA